jgi:hypothetical protein
MVMMISSLVCVGPVNYGVVGLALGDHPGVWGDLRMWGWGPHHACADMMMESSSSHMVFLVGGGVWHLLGGE